MALLTLLIPLCRLEGGPIPCPTANKGAGHRSTGRYAALRMVGVPESARYSFNSFFLDLGTVCSDNLMIRRKLTPPTAESVANPLLGFVMHRLKTSIQIFRHSRQTCV